MKRPYKEPDAIVSQSRIHHNQPPHNAGVDCGAEGGIRTPVAQRARRLQRRVIDHSTTSALLPSKCIFKIGSSQQRDLNPRPSLYKSAALPLSYAGSCKSGALPLSYSGIFSFFRARTSWMRPVLCRAGWAECTERGGVGMLIASCSCLSFSQYFSLALAGSLGTS